MEIESTESTESTGELAMHIDGESAIVVGDPAAIAALFERINVAPASSASVGQAVADTVAAVSGLGATAMTMRPGTWFQMTADSRRRLDELGVFNQTADGIVAGLIRGDKGRIDTVAQFVRSGAVNPSSLAAGPALAAIVALRLAVKNLEDLVQGLDVKLDQVLQDSRTREMGNLEGITHVLSKSYGLFEESGTITATTWDQVTTHATQLAQSHAVALEHLDSLAKGLEAASFKRKLDGAKYAAGGELKLWLLLTAVCLVNMVRMDALEIAHAKAQDATTVAAHVAGIERAKEERREKTLAKVKALAEVTAKAGQMNALTRVMNPIEAGQLEGYVEEIQRLIGAFSQGMGMPLETGLVVRHAWHESIRELAQDLGEGVAGAAATLATGVTSAPKAIGTAVEDSVLGLAQHIQSRREPEAEPSQAAASIESNASEQAAGSQSGQ